MSSCYFFHSDRLLMDKKRMHPNKQFNEESLMTPRPFFTLFVAILFLAACAPQATSTPEPTAPPTPKPLENAAPGELFIDPQAGLGPISPFIYGSNYGPWTAVPADMLQVAYDSKITVLRWPGGAWGDNNVIQTSQLDYFIAFCQKMGAIPTISVRLKNGTPEAAAELVRYANIDKGYNILYWSIGNEPTLFEAEMNETYDTVRFNREWRAIAEAIKAVDPTIKLMGPELHQWGPTPETTLKDLSGRDWMVEFLKANGDLVDIVTVHRYPLWRDGRTQVTIDDLRNNTPEWTQMVIFLRSMIQELTGRDLPIAFTEVNSSPTAALLGIGTPDSFYNAIWYADVAGSADPAGRVHAQSIRIGKPERRPGLDLWQPDSPDLLHFPNVQSIWQ